MPTWGTEQKPTRCVWRTATLRSRPDNQQCERSMGMGKAGVGLIKGIDVEEIVDTLDSYYCYNLVVMHFSHALRNRLEGQAAFLLGDELEENAEQGLKAAKKLADRIGDLGGGGRGGPRAGGRRTPVGAGAAPG